MVSGLRFYFYADASDMKAVLSALHSTHPLRYTNESGRRRVH